MKIIQIQNLTIRAFDIYIYIYIYIVTSEHYNVIYITNWLKYDSKSLRLLNLRFEQHTLLEHYATV